MIEGNGGCGGAMESTPFLTSLVELVSHEFKPTMQRGIFLNEKAKPGTPLVDEDLFGQVVARHDIAEAADWTLKCQTTNQPTLGSGFKGLRR